MLILRLHGYIRQGTGGTHMCVEGVLLVGWGGERMARYLRETVII